MSQVQSRSGLNSGCRDGEDFVTMADDGSYCVTQVSAARFFKSVAFDQGFFIVGTTSL